MTTPGEEAGASYDALPYDSHPFPATHPDRLHTLARLVGLDPAPVERARVLELGCAAGGNLLPLAVDLPGGRFVGVDASRRQLDDGRALAAALGLGNCELLQGDLLTLDPAALGTFDYVLCHGVYSWVPRPVQDAILALARACLAPHGVAYVSYNTLPGWRMRGMIRDMCRWHARQFEDPRTAVTQSRRLLEYLEDRARADTTAYAQVLRAELDILRRQSDAYLFHEHLEAHNEPVYFHEFAARAERAGLRYLGEASLGETEATLAPELGDQGRGSAPMVEAEQYRDFVRNRLFRATLLVHAERDPWPAARPEAVPGLFVSAAVELYTPGPEAPPAGTRSAPLERGAGEGAAGEGAAGTEWRTRWGRLVRTTSPLVAAALARLGAAWPAALPFDALLEAARADAGRRAEGDRALLAEVLLRAYAVDAVELRPRPLPVAATPGPRPRASRLARAQRALGRLECTNARHESVLLDPLDRETLDAADGTRDVEGIIDAVVDGALAGRLTVRRDGVVVSDRAGLRDLLEEAVPRSLAKLSRSALL